MHDSLLPMRTENSRFEIASLRLAMTEIRCERVSPDFAMAIRPQVVKN